MFLRERILDLLRPSRWTPAALMLVLVNAVPLVAIFVFRWDAADLVLLYWTENLIVGAFNVLRMLVADPSDGSGPASKLFMIPFFIIHFGIFCTVHGMFLMFLLEIGAGSAGPQFDAFGSGGLLGMPGALVRALWTDASRGATWVLAGLAVSHGVSFVQYSLLGGERTSATVSQLMMRPYQRIVVMHITIMAGVAVTLFLDSPPSLLAILVLVKLIVDLVLHHGAHQH